MCDPATIAAITAGIAATAGAAGTVQAGISSARNAEAINEAENESLVRQYTDVQARRIEEQRAAAFERDRVAREARSKVATASVAASEAGVSGITGGEAVMNILTQEGRSIQAIDTNLQSTLEQTERTSEGLRANSLATSRQAAASVPSPASVGVNLIGQTAKGASDVYTSGAFS